MSFFKIYNPVTFCRGLKILITRKQKESVTPEYSNKVTNKSMSLAMSLPTIIVIFAIITYFIPGIAKTLNQLPSIALNILLVAPFIAVAYFILKAIVLFVKSTCELGYQSV